MMESTLLTRPRSRRDVIRLTGAVAAGLLCAANPAFAANGRWTRHDAIMRVLDGAEPVASGVRLELPSVSEDGSSVPLTVSVDSPMSDDNHVESIHLFAPQNPNAEIASFHLTPLAGEARVETRIRLNESQRVFALARLSSGEFRIGEREARVTVSGCLMDADTYDASDVMSARVRVPQSLAPGEIGEVLTLINHPMETGFRENSEGEVLPRHIIEEFRAELDGEPVITARLNTSMSANPYLRFHLRAPDSGTLTFSWRDDQGASTREQASIRVG